MPLLTLEHVTMRYVGSTRRERAALRDVSFSIERGELVAVAGTRRSGRTTLARIAAGVIPPSAGSVRFGDVDPARHPLVGAPLGISYALPHFEPAIGRSVLEHVATPMLARGFSMLRARIIAYDLLRRAGVASHAWLCAAELSRPDALRVAVARALITSPALLLVDDPADVPPNCDDPELLTLLRAIAHHEATAVILMTDTGVVPDGVDRTFMLDRGALRALPPSAAPYGP
jgi:ABC-type ATPase involved in cell division